MVEPSALAEYFELLISIYERDPNGKLLVEWFKTDWLLFDHERMDIPRAKSLLADILDDGEIVRQQFAPSPLYKNDRLVRWNTLRTELMYENRYFPEAQIDKDRLDELFDHLTAVEMPSVWYRARLQVDDHPFPLSEMGAPPRRLVSHGRANPPGIPYLYLNSTPGGAISELRPHTGEIACVATYEFETSFRAVDLRSPRKTVSPFVFEDENQIGLLREDISFLERLGEELTIPVLPQGAAIDYVPSQFLCEFIKKCGYDAVVYRSSVSDGINLALFDPKKIAPREVAQYKVSRVAVEVDPSSSSTAGMTCFTGKSTTEVT